MNKTFLNLLLVAGVFFSTSCGGNKESGEEQVEKTETRCPFKNAYYELTDEMVNQLKQDLNK